MFMIVPLRIENGKNFQNIYTSVYSPCQLHIKTSMNIEKMLREKKEKLGILISFKAYMKIGTSNFKSINGVSR